MKKLQKKIQSVLHWKTVGIFLLFLNMSVNVFSETITLNPTADTDSQSDVAAGTNPTLNASQWCHLFIRFDLSSVSGTVSSAKLRIYQPNGQSAYTMNVSTTSTDTWSEGGTKPSQGSLVTSKSLSGAAGYVEIDITSHVQTKLAGNKVVSLTLTTNLGTWTSFNSRQASSNKPELVIVTNTVPVTGVTVSPTSLSLTVGQTGQLTAIVQPADATNKNVSWSSSNTSVATVNSSGLVTAIAAGNATITVTTQDGGKTATCAVTVAAPSSLTKYEAENATLTGVSIANSLSGFSGSGYMDGNSFDQTGDKIVFTVNVPSAGQYPLVVRFQNTCGVCEKYQNIKINGGADNYTRFNGTTGGWEDLNYGNIALNAGNNTIEINKSWGWTHIDYITVGTSGGGTVPVTGVTVSPTSLSLTVGQTGQLTATVQPADATNKNVSWSSSNTSVATVNSSGLVTAVAAGNATITVTTQDGGKTATCSVTVTSAALPSPWQTMDVGNVGLTGSATYSNGSFTVKGSGSDIWGTADAFRFVYQSLNGDGEIKAKVTSQTNTDAWAKAGVMIRESLSADSKHAFACVTPSNGLAFQRRTSTSGTSEHTSGGSGSAPVWVKLVRSGNIFTGFRSSDGNNWTQMGSATMSMNSTVYIGLAITSHNNSSLSTAVIDNVTVTVGGGTVPVTGVTVNPTSLSLAVGQTGQLTATVQPSDATNKNVSWSSSNTSVATVNSSGLVTAVAAGNATITVTTQDGGKTATCSVTVTTSGGTTGSMTPGTNFWHIGWEGWQNTFKSGVNWSTTSDPWNPTFINELIEAKIKCLRFMDWNQTNHGCIQNWSQRIPKTANHYNQDNLLPCFVDNYDAATNTHNLVWNGRYDYGVAYEWQIDLCNRIGADLWINIPVTATADFQYQLATLIKNTLNSNLKVYVEWGNEIWNWGFASTVYAYQQANALGLQNVNVGAYCDPWRKYTVYASVRAFEQFERVFGTNSPRLVKVLAGQVGYHWDGYDYNHMVKGDLACLANSTINPNGITINAYAMAPYMGGQTISEQQNNISICAQQMQWAKNSLTGTNIALICYEGGADNYPDNGLILTRNSAQEQMYNDYLTMLSQYCTGVFNQYTFYGGCWGLKYSAGESASINPKWRGWLNYWNNALKSGTIAEEGNETTYIRPSDSKNIRIYPNPITGNVLNVELGKKIAEREGTLMIRDITGKMVYQVRLPKGTERTAIHTASYYKGIYILQVATGSVSETVSFIVQ